MLHKTWNDSKPIKKIECVHANAAKYVVDTVLTPGKTYDVQNETEDAYFIIDNTGKVGGFKKVYFKEL